MVQPVLEWRRGAMRRDLRVGTYAFGGATPGDQRVLAALGGGRRPAAIVFKSLFNKKTRIGSLINFQANQSN